jgi:EpsI family protein
MLAWRRVAIAAGVLTVGILCLGLVSHGEIVPLRRSLDEFSLRVGVREGVKEGIEPAIIEALGVTDFMMRRYSVPDRPPIWLYVGYYASQRTGVIIHSPKQCLPGSGWSILKIEQAQLTVRGRDPDRITVNRVIVGKGRERQLVLYWYQERGRIVASEYRAKAYMLWDSVTRARTDGALVRVSTPAPGSEEEAFRQAAEFAQSLLPMLNDFLPG